MGQGTRPPKGTVPRTAIFAQGASARVRWGNEPRTDGGREKKWLDDKTAAESDSVIERLDKILTLRSPIPLPAPLHAVQAYRTACSARMPLRANREGTYSYTNPYRIAYFSRRRSPWHVHRGRGSGRPVAASDPGRQRVLKDLLESYTSTPSSIPRRKGKA